MRVAGIFEAVGGVEEAGEEGSGERMPDAGNSGSNSDIGLDIGTEVARQLCGHAGVLHANFE